MFCFASSASTRCATAQVWMAPLCSGDLLVVSTYSCLHSQRSSMWSEYEGLVLVLVLTRRLSLPIHHNLVAGSQSPGKVNVQETKHLTTQKLPFLKQLENNFFFFLRAVWWCFSGAGVGVGVFNIFPSDKVAHGHPGQCPGDTKLCAPGGQRCSIQEKDLDRLERWSCEKLMTPNKAK